MGFFSVLWQQLKGRNRATGIQEVQRPTDPGMLSQMEKWPPLLGKRRWTLTVFPSFNPPWRFLVELGFESVSYELMHWSIRSRWETGGSSFSMAKYIDACPPLVERGEVSLSDADEIIALDSSATFLRDAIVATVPVNVSEIANNLR